MCAMYYDESIKSMRHMKRVTLTPNDPVNIACVFLRLSVGKPRRRRQTVTDGGHKLTRS